MQSTDANDVSIAGLDRMRLRLILTLRLPRWKTK